MVELGKAKDEKRIPIFNWAIDPLFCEDYQGSITNVSQFTFMADKVREYVYLKVGFILDRRYFSKGKIQHMDRSYFSFIIMDKDSS